jgi:hypothetical protein
MPKCSAQRTLVNVGKDNLKMGLDKAAGLPYRAITRYG